MCQHGGLTNKTNKSIVKNKNNILGKTNKKISGFFSGQTTKRGVAPGLLRKNHLLSKAYYKWFDHLKKLLLYLCALQK